MSKRIKIGTREVGDGCSPFVVAEVGINHNGELDLAIQMIRVAKASGCDAVKFQTFKAVEFINDHAQTYTYKSQGREVTESMMEMFQRYELTEAGWRSIKDECVRQDIQFISTPQNRSDLEFLRKLGVPAVKVGSDDFTYIPQLRDFAKSGLPLILSTGMSDLADVQKALDAVGAFDGYPVVLLVCTSQYPTPPGDAHLLRIRTLAAAFPGIPVGFSDHTQGPQAAAMAVALGAVLFEKHFTLDVNLPGPDHWFSEEPDGLSAWVRSIRDAETMLGKPYVRPTDVERVNRRDFQRRLIAARKIEVGEVFHDTNVTMLRSKAGMGLPVDAWALLQGKPAHRAYEEGEPIDF
jgi:N,N'-diacetyllegionaminate synthase